MNGLPRSLLQLRPRGLRAGLRRLSGHFHGLSSFGATRLVSTSLLRRSSFVVVSARRSRSGRRLDRLTWVPLVLLCMAVCCPVLPPKRSKSCKCHSPVARVTRHSRRADGLRNFLPSVEIGISAANECGLKRCRRENRASVLGTQKQRVVNVAKDAWLATAGLRGGQVLEASSRTFFASYTRLPSASAGPQGLVPRDGLGSLVVSPCYAVTSGWKVRVSYGRSSFLAHFLPSRLPSRLVVRVFTLTERKPITTRACVFSADWRFDQVSFISLQQTSQWTIEEVLRRRASRSSSHVGGMLGHVPNSPVALGGACWWLSLVWLGAGAPGLCLALVREVVVSFSISLCDGADPKTGRDQKIPLRQASPQRRCSTVSCPLPVSCPTFWDFGFLAPEAPSRRASWLLCVRRDGSDGWRSPVPRRDNTGRGATLRTPSANHRLPSPPTGPEHRDGLGSLVASPCVEMAGPMSLRRRRLRVEAQASGTSIPDVSAPPGVEASSITPCRGRRIRFSLDPSTALRVPQLR